MNIDFLRSKSRLIKKRLTRQRSAMGSAFSETEAAHASYKKEFGDIAGAQTAFDEAKTAGLKTFGKTGTGQRLDAIGKKYNIDNLSQFAGSGNVTGFGSNLRNKLQQAKEGTGKWKQATASAGILDAYFSGQKYKGEMVHDSLVQRHARELGFDTSNISFSGGKASKARQGRTRTGGWGPFKFDYWDATAKWSEDVTSRFTDTKSRLKQLHDDLGFSDVEKDIGFLTGRTRDFSGKETAVENFGASQEFKDYNTSLEPTRTQLAQEQTEAGAAEKIFREKEGIFTSAKERFDTTTADYTKLVGRIKKFERLGMGQEIKSKRFKQARAGAGSYL